MIKCPRCSSVSMELIECENCKTIGCVKCIPKYIGRLLCQNCRSGSYVYDEVKTEVEPEAGSPESALADMFG